MDRSNLSVGEHLDDRYLVLDRFSGSMGVVYLVEDTSPPANATTPQKMIAKTLLPNLYDAPSLVRQFLDEAEIWIRLSTHTNAVRAYRVESIGGLPIVFAEFIRRAILPNSLAEWIHFRITPLEVALHFAVQLLDGLWYAYQDDVELHGDLKPSNILIDEDLTVKINDWGLALSTRNQGLAEIAQWYARYHAASPYLAPEARGSHPEISRSMDGFAFGVVFGEMLTGERLRVGTRREEIAAKFTPACIGCSDNVRESVAAIVAELIAPEPDVRKFFYETHARSIVDIFSELTGINVIDDSASIIIRPQPPGQAEQQAHSIRVIGDARRRLGRDDDA